MHVTIGTPEGYTCDHEVIQKAKKLAMSNGGSVIETTNPVEAVNGADAVYTDVWTSMGQEEEAAHVLKHLKIFKLTMS